MATSIYATQSVALAHSCLACVAFYKLHFSFEVSPAIFLITTKANGFCLFISHEGSKRCIELQNVFQGENGGPGPAGEQGAQGERVSRYVFK